MNILAKFYPCQSYRLRAKCHEILVTLGQLFDCQKHASVHNDPFHDRWSTVCKGLLQDGCRAWVKRTRGHDTSHAKFEAEEKDQGYTLFHTVMRPLYG